jgi:hypothetical protein
VKSYQFPQGFQLSQGPFEQVATRHFAAGSLATKHAPAPLEESFTIFVLSKNPADGLLNFFICL